MAEKREKTTFKKQGVGVSVSDSSSQGQLHTESAGIASGDKQSLFVSPRLIFKDQSPHSSANVYLQGLHLMDLVTANLSLKMRNGQGETVAITSENSFAIFDTVRPYVTALFNLDNSIRLVRTLLNNGSEKEMVHSLDDIKKVFGKRLGTETPGEAKKAFETEYSSENALVRYVSSYKFGDGVPACAFVASFMEYAVGQVKPLLTLAEPQPIGIDGVYSVAGAKHISRKLAVAYHEWLTPVTALKGAMEIANKRIQVLDRTDTAAAGKIVGIVSLMMEQVSRLETNRSEIHEYTQEAAIPRDIPMRQALAEMADLLRSQLGIGMDDDRVAVESLEDLPEDAFIHLPPRLLTLIGVNALQNAERSYAAELVQRGVDKKEAMRQAEKEVKITLGVGVNKEGRHVKITIGDNGKGLSDGRRGIFFTNGVHGYGEGVDSHGIIMSALSEDVKDFGGSLFLVQNRVQKGATVVVRLPYFQS